nr:uncharacterized protein LOC105873689 [Microcebus murinus]
MTQSSQKSHFRSPSEAAAVTGWSSAPAAKAPKPVCAGQERTPTAPDVPGLGPSPPRPLRLDLNTSVCLARCLWLMNVSAEWMNGWMDCPKVSLQVLFQVQPRTGMGHTCCYDKPQTANPSYHILRPRGTVGLPGFSATPVETKSWQLQEPWGLKAVLFYLPPLLGLPASPFPGKDRKTHPKIPPLLPAQAAESSPGVKIHRESEAERRQVRISGVDHGEWMEACLGSGDPSSRLSDLFLRALEPGGLIRLSLRFSEIIF